MADGNQLNVQYVAKLARIALSADEASAFSSQLEDVLRYIDKLKQVDVTDVEPASQISPVFNVFRADEARDWFTAEDALQNAPRHADDLFTVTRVIE